MDTNIVKNVWIIFLEQQIYCLKYNNNNNNIFFFDLNKTHKKLDKLIII